MSLLDHELALRLENNERLRSIIREIVREEVEAAIEQERIATYVRDASRLLFRDERKGLES